MTARRVVVNTEIRVGVEVVAIYDGTTDEVSLSSIDIMSGDPLAVVNEYTRWNPACLSSCERVHLEQLARDKAVADVADELTKENFRAYFARKVERENRLQEKMATIDSRAEEEKVNELISWINAGAFHA
jgi:hypothetical protein